MSKIRRVNCHVCIWFICGFGCFNETNFWLSYCINQSIWETITIGCKSLLGVIIILLCNWKSIFESARREKKATTTTSKRIYQMSPLTVTSQGGLDRYDAMKKTFNKMRFLSVVVQQTLFFVPRISRHSSFCILVHWRHIKIKLNDFSMVFVCIHAHRASGKQNESSMNEFIVRIWAFAIRFVFPIIVFVLFVVHINLHGSNALSLFSVFASDPMRFIAVIQTHKFCLNVAYNAIILVLQSVHPFAIQASAFARTPNSCICQWNQH